MSLLLEIESLSMSMSTRVGGILVHDIIGDACGEGGGGGSMDDSEARDDMCGGE